MQIDTEKFKRIIEELHASIGHDRCFETSVPIGDLGDCVIHITCIDKDSELSDSTDGPVKEYDCISVD